MSSTYATVLRETLVPARCCDVDLLMTLFDKSSPKVALNDSVHLRRLSDHRHDSGSATVSTIAYLERLDADSRTQTATFGNSWLRPIGISKTMAQQQDEERELQDSFEVCPTIILSRDQMLTIAAVVRGRRWLITSTERPEHDAQSS